MNKTSKIKHSNINILRQNLNTLLVYRLKLEFIVYEFDIRGQRIL